MRGRRNAQSTMLASVNLDERVPPDHSLRIIKKVADDVPDRMSSDFDRMYSRIGRASVPPEHLLKSLLLISLYSTRVKEHSASNSTTACSTLVHGHGPGEAELRRCSSRTGEDF